MADLLPKAATMVDGRAVLLGWAGRNAEPVNEPPVKDLIRALAEDYPCNI